MLWEKSPLKKDERSAASIIINTVVAQTKLKYVFIPADVGINKSSAIFTLHKLDIGWYTDLKNKTLSCPVLL